MRQIGTLPNLSQAERFASFLLTRGIATQLDPDQDQWIVWVLDEDRLEDAKSELAAFRAAPDAGKYQGVEKQAEAILQEQQQHRERTKKNIVHMRGRWSVGFGGTQRKGFTLMFIAATVIISVLAGFDAQQRHETAIYQQLQFSHPQNWDLQDLSRTDYFYDIKRGQIWRIMTPVFLHGSWAHLIINMIFLYFYGAKIETRYGPWVLAALVVAIGFSANLIEAFVPDAWGATPTGIGMSGVVYGLFGFIWLRMILAPSDTLNVPLILVIIQIVMLMAGFSGMLDALDGGGDKPDNIDHWAHALGLVVGAVYAFVPNLINRTKSN